MPGQKCPGTSWAPPRRFWGGQGGAWRDIINQLTFWQFCKENHFCPGGAANDTTICPDGKYSLPGSDDPGDCLCPERSSSRQNAKYATECICDSGFYKEFNSIYVLGGWYCRWCQPGEFCYNNTNRTCPEHSTSFGVSKSYSDCFCNPGYKNTTVHNEASFCEDCPANYYCTGKGAVEACVANALSPSQSTDNTRCYCDLGWKGVKNSVCIACQSPKYCYSGLEATCSEGTFSPPLSFDRLNCSCVAGRWGPSGAYESSKGFNQRKIRESGSNSVSEPASDSVSAFSASKSEIHLSSSSIRPIR